MTQATRSESTVDAVAQRRYWHVDDARVVVTAWRRSGMTTTAFAARHGISARRLTHWTKRLELPRRSAERRSAPRRMRFLPVHVVGADAAPVGLPHGSGGTAIEIALSDGRTIRLPSGFRADDLARVLAVLEDAAPGGV